MDRHPQALGECLLAASRLHYVDSPLDLLCRGGSRVYLRSARADVVGQLVEGLQRCPPQPLLLYLPAQRRGGLGLGFRLGLGKSAPRVLWSHLEPNLRAKL